MKRHGHHPEGLAHDLRRMVQLAGRRGFMRTLAGVSLLPLIGCAADGGVASFTTISPGCYPGRWPHIHFELFESLAGAAAATGKVQTSQLAMPAAACDEAYATSGYEASVGNLANISLASDNVFSDG